MENLSVDTLAFLEHKISEVDKDLKEHYKVIGELRKLRQQLYWDYEQALNSLANMGIAVVVDNYQCKNKTKQIELDK